MNCNQIASAFHHRVGALTSFGIEKEAAGRLVRVIRASEEFERPLFILLLWTDYKY
jgi:hypothetical protein